jgi:hypothetical protein
MSSTLKYSVTFQKSTAKLLLTYSNGHLKRIEIKSGSMLDEHWEALTKVLPQMQKDLPDFIAKYEGKVQYTPIGETDKQSIYQRFMSSYFLFHNEYVGISPKITAIEGKALKEIVSYLCDQSATEDEALAVWQVLLNSWDKLEEFYQKQHQLRQINSNLPNLLVNIKYGKKGTTAHNSATRAASGAREKL